MGRRWEGTAVALLLTGVLAGCSSTTAGAPVAGTDTPQLDTGNYPTKPRRVVAKTAADAWQQESLRMADAVVSPPDVDPSVTTDRGKLSMVAFDPYIFTMALGEGIFSSEQVAALRSVTLQAGYIMGAANEDGSRVVRMGLLRFPDEATAKAAVDKLAALGTKSTQSATHGKFVTGGTDQQGRFIMTAMRVVGDLVALVNLRLASAPADPNTEMPMIRKGLDAQVAKAAEYKPTTVKPGAYLPPVPMDRDGIMSRTLPVTRTTPMMGLSPGVSLRDGYMSPRTYVNGDPSAAVVSERYGIDLVGATPQTIVFRARDAEAAHGYYSTTAPQDGESVPGVPHEDARCSTSPNEAGYYACDVTVGRYVAQVLAKSKPQVRQAASAEYLILQAADR